LLIAESVQAQKTDVVTLTNGDRITGEITKLEAGLLEFKTDTMGTVSIEWRFIDNIESDKSQMIEMLDGTRLLGQLQKPNVGHDVLVRSETGNIEVPPEEVVSVWPVKATFKDRMDIDLSMGLDYSKSTSIGGLNAAVDFRLRGEDRLTEAMLRSNLIRQTGTDDLSRYQLDGFHEYLLPNQRFRNWFAGIESNDALGVDLRLSIGAGFGKYLIKSNSEWFTIQGGLAMTQENPEKSDSETNVEAVANVRYRYFRFADPERSLDTSLSVFPSLTDGGRVRADFQTTFKLELIQDMFWAMEFYANYDNEPQSLDSEEFDYGIVTSVGWSY
jgi:hypothetical protein